MAKQVKKKETGFAALSAENREWLKQYEDLGWLVEFDNDQWTGTKKVDGSDAITIGPSDAFTLVMNQIENAEINHALGDEKLPKGHAKAKADARGNTYLPGTEPIVVQELVDAAKEYEEVKRARMKLTAEEKDAKDALINIAHKYEEHFTEGEDGELVYHAAGISVIRIVDKTEKIKTKLDDYSEDDE